MISEEELQEALKEHDVEVERQKAKLQALSEKITKINERYLAELAPLEDEYSSRVTDLHRRIGAMTQVRALLGEQE